MKNTTLALAGAPLLTVGLLAACTSDPGPGDASSAPASQAASPNPSSETTHSPSAAASPSSRESVESTVVRFTAGDASTDVTIGEDSPASRDFLSVLPMTLRLEEFNAREKIGDMSRELHWQGSPGSDPEDGDLIYYVPWGNLGFYYDASGIGYSDQTIHLGTYDAREADLVRFEGQETRVEVVE